jgi:hypothetical protein
MHNHVGEFKDLLTAEVHAALRAVRELENQKRSLQSDIAELMSVSGALNFFLNL